ncbi:butyrophilin subfamily 1 member A1-like [Chroicocephalus ridibundus]|uniref:butyrophilin subfamily 1 member A1-like n=1 Tax=Chroicocephalus ridibundus TaxID=1192867 RepID=UPI002FDCDF54
MTQDPVLTTVKDCEVPLTISIEPSVVLVEDQVTLSCQVTDNVPSNTSVLWYKMEKGRDAPLCSSSSLGGVVEQCKDEDEWRIVGHWKGRALLLVIQQVQVADEGTYVCALNGSAVMQEATTRLGVTAIGYKPTVDRDVQEENMCRYTCKSKKWYPKPEVIWMNYGGDAVNVEAETNVTWSERDRFTVQSIITVSCDNLDVVCVVKLVKSKISRSGAMNEIIVPHSSSCTYKGRISGSYVKPKVMWINPQGEDVSLLAQTSILQETDNIFTIESSIELPCGQPPPSFVTTEGERRPQIAQQSENGNFIWIICLLVLIILPAVLERQIEKLLSQDRTTRHAEKGNPKEIAVLERQIEKLLSQDRTTRHAEKGNPKEIAVLERQIENLKKEIVDQRKEIEFRKARGNADDIKVDGNTAHPNLSIDADEKSFTYKSQAQKVTQTERSFDSSVCVLGSKGFSSGKHYWEVDVEKSNDWDLGVAGKSAPKKGTISLSPKEQFWALGLSFKNYWARTDPWTPLTVQKKPKKIGVYLDCEERMLTFFNVTDMSVMFTFKDCAFSEELYPFFKNSHKESTMRICSVREE